MRSATVLSIHGLPSVISAPVATKTSAAGENPITVDLLLPDDVVHSANKLRAQRTNDELAAGVPNWAGSSLVAEVQPAGDNGADVAFALLSDPMPSGPNYVRFAEESGDATLAVRGSVYSPWSNVVGDTFAGAGAALNPLTVTIGDSWYGNANPPYPGFYMGYYFGTHPEHAVLNMGLGGQGLTWLRQHVAAIIAQQPYVLCISFARNDFMNGSYTQYAGDDAAEFAAYVAYYRSCLDDIRAGCPGIAIMVETPTERHASDSEAYNTKYNTWRPQLIAAIKQWRTDGVIAAVGDIGSDSVLGAVGGFQRPTAGVTDDGLHLTEAASQGAASGHGKAYPIFAAATDALYAATPLPSEDLVSTFSIQASAVTVTVTEGNSGTTLAPFTVSRAGALSQTASVDWTVSGSGTNPASAADFAGGVFPTGTLNFAAGESQKTINVPVAGDATYEPDEGFTVTLSNPKVTGKLGTQASQTGTIVNDDAQGSSPVSFAAIAGQEGNGGFSGGYTFGDVTLPAGTNRFVFALYSYGNRAPASAKLTKAGTDYAATLLGSGYALTLWSVDVGPGTYTPSMVAGGAPFAYVGIQGIALGNAGAVSQMQAKGSGQYNPPVEMAAAQVVATGGLGLVFFGTEGGSITRNDGSTERASLKINDSFGDASYLTIATLPATAKPSISPTTGTKAEGFSLSVAKG